jgi:diacylglycerol kinase family enzyme
MPSRHILLVGNPTAQSGKNAERIEHARQLLRSRGVSHELMATEPEGRTVGKIAERLAGGDVTVVASMGGDGTFAEVARGIFAAHRAEEIPLGMLPTGTANDQGKSFGLDADDGALDRNLHVLLDAQETRLDVGRLISRDASGVALEEILFFDSVGWGISARTLALRNEDRQTVAQIPILREVYRDQLVYAGALVRTFLASYVEEHKFDVEIDADGVIHHLDGLTDLIVKGTRIYGGLWLVDKDARHDDGLFEVVPFQGKRDWISKALVMLKGPALELEDLAKMGLSHSENFSARKMRIVLRPRPGGEPIYGQVDGEVFNTAALVDIEVLPRALRLIVPRDEAAPS